MRRSKDSYRANTEESKQRQLEALEEGRKKRWNKERAKKRTRSIEKPAYEPWDAIYRDDICRFLEEQFVITYQGQPQLIRLEPFQKDNLTELFSRDSEGKRKYSLAIWSCCKKGGKTTISAGVALYELFQGESYGEVLWAANSREQATLRGFSILKRAVELNPAMADVCRVTQEVVTNTVNQTEVRCVSQNPSTIAGCNFSLCAMDEIWCWTSEESKLFYDELALSPARKEPMIFISSYAGFWEEGVLWDLYKRGLAGTDGRMFFLWSHDPHIASWITKEYLETQRKRLRENTFRRLHQNEWTSSESVFVSPEEYAACVDPLLKPVALPDKSLKIYVGIDASVSGDTTAVTAVAKVGDKVRVITHRKWAPTTKEKIDFEVIENFILELHRKFKVKACFFDPYQMISSAQRLTKKGVKMVEYSQTEANLTQMTNNLYDLIQACSLAVYENEELREHVLNAKIKETPRGLKLIKTTQSKKIDLVVALAMACIGCIKTPDDGRPRIRMIDIRPDKTMKEDWGWERIATINLF